MKANFATKQKKAAKKKKQKLSKKNKAKTAGAEGDDEAMADAAMVEDEPEPVADAIEENGQQTVPSARDKHRKAVTLKHSLKAKVQDLKKTRQKVTKAANSKGARRQLTDQIKSLRKKPNK